MTCNGLSNVETWTVSLWYGEYLREILEENTELRAEDLRAIVEDIALNEQYETDGFVADVVNSFLNAVDWIDLYNNLTPVEA